MSMMSTSGMMTLKGEMPEAPFIVPARLNSRESSTLTGETHDDTARFLAALTAGGPTTFQTFDDTSAKRKHLARVLHGPMVLHAAFLQRLNQQGAGVFVMVNQGDGRGRRATNVVASRALFVDLDGAPLEPVMDAAVPPNIVVETSPGRWHAYWLVDSIPLDSFTHLQAQLAQRFSADPSVKDVARVMRLPGFVHNKGIPWRTRLVSVRDGPKIAFEAFIKALGLTPFMPVGERNMSLFRAAAGFNRAGIPKSAAQGRVAKMNSTATEAPLDAAELTTLVDNAYSYAVAGFSMVPHMLIDTPEFADLSAAAVKLLMYALRRHRGSNDFALPHSEFSEIVGLKNRKQFRAAVEELIAGQFLIMMRNYVAGVAQADRICALYRIHDRVQVVR